MKSVKFRSLYNKFAEIMAEFVVLCVQVNLKWERSQIKFLKKYVVKCRKI